MLWTITILLIVLWALAVFSGYTMDSSIHILLALAVVLALARVLRGQTHRVFAPWKDMRGKKQFPAAVDDFNGDSIYLLGRFTDPEPVAPDQPLGNMSKEGRDPYPAEPPLETSVIGPAGLH